MLFIITSTGDLLFSNNNINDLEPGIGAFSGFYSRFSAAEERLLMK